MSPILHYIHDPLCGWCYAAAPLLRAAREVLPVAAHGGGMMAGSRRQPVTPQLRNYVMPHDRRIEQMTGQPFGEAYFEGLLRDPTAVFDSEPSTTAMLAAQALAPGADLDLLARMQKAHYVEGLRIAEPAVLVELAVQVGLDRDEFARAFEQALGAATQAHIAASLDLLDRVGGRGFPTFALQRSPEEIEMLDFGRYLGRPEAWKAALARTIATAADAAPLDQAGPACDVDGCGLG